MPKIKLKCEADCKEHIEPVELVRVWGWTNIRKYCQTAIQEDASSGRVVDRLSEQEIRDLF